MLLVPYQADVPMFRWPISNFVILGLMGLVFLLELQMSESVLVTFVLGGPSWLGWIGHLWLHADVLHLLGNGAFLWVFGNAVCAKMGNKTYPPVYLGLGLAAAAIHMTFDGDPALGASGAINGIVGMFVAWYPRNEISCFYWIWIRIGTFEVSSFWMILLWFGFDVWGALSGGGGTAYYAHLGGFAAGLVLALFLEKAGHVSMDRHERTLLQMVKDRSIRARPPLREARRNGTAPPPWMPPTATPPPAPKPPALIPFTCACGKFLRAQREYAGRRVKCPGCGEPVVVPK